MIHKSAQKSQSPHAYAYGAAIAKAVEWLGDRYLLAKPINATPGFAGAEGQCPKVSTRPKSDQLVSRVSL